jgi:hypothetical protein
LPIVEENKEYQFQGSSYPRDWYHSAAIIFAVFLTLKDYWQSCFLNLGHLSISSIFDAFQRKWRNITLIKPAICMRLLNLRIRQSIQVVIVLNNNTNTEHHRLGPLVI